MSMTQQLYDKQNLKHVKQRLPHSISTMSTNSHCKSSSLWSTKKKQMWKHSSNTTTLLT